METKTLSTNWELTVSPRDQLAEISAGFPIGDYRYSGYNKNGEMILEVRLSIASCEKKWVKKVSSIVSRAIEIFDASAKSY